MKFLCDEMLSRLGRWLRAAGYDVALAENGVTDAMLVTQAGEEGRLLITCDRQIAEHRAAEGNILLLGSCELEDAIAEVTARLAIDWLHDPFSRCLEDNTPLRPASADQIAALPSDTRSMPGPILACPACGRVYWPGSHFRRMRARLEKWRELSPAIDNNDAGRPSGRAKE